MPLYLDNNATTALDPTVLESMLPYMQSIYGNPSSVHRFGRLTRDALEHARIQVANLVGAQPTQVIFTSGGTEANNLAIKGTLACLPKGRFAVSAIEHSSVLAASDELVAAGWQCDVIAVDAAGKVEPQVFADALHSDTRFATVMMANNETGVIQDVQQLSQLARKKDVLFHTDASQAAGKIPVDYAALGGQHDDLFIAQNIWTSRCWSLDC